jgi:hypothetical protein
MKITIDTKEDSHEEIRKVIRMLSSLIGEKEVFSNAPQIDEQKTGDAFSAMFSQPAEKTDDISEDKKPMLDEIPRIIEY